MVTGGGFHRTAPQLGKQLISEFSFNSKNYPVLVRQFSGAGQWITAIDFSPDGKTLVATGTEGSISVWKPDESEARLTSLKVQQLANNIPAHSKEAKYGSV